jgi:hypothetical protein
VRPSKIGTLVRPSKRRVSCRTSKRRMSFQESDRADLCIEIRVTKVENNRNSDYDGEDANDRDHYRELATQTRGRCALGIISGD